MIEKTESWPKINMRFRKRHNYQKKKSKRRTQCPSPLFAAGSAGTRGDTSAWEGHCHCHRVPRAPHAAVSCVGSAVTECSLPGSRCYTAWWKTWLKNTHLVLCPKP